MEYFHRIFLILFIFNNVIADNIESCDSTIYCQGKLLHTIQMARLFSDSKTFVDMSQKNPPDVTMQNFNNLMKAKNDNPSKDDLVQFVKENFDSAGELVEWTPPDFNKNPAFIERIENERVKKFAQNLVNIWPKLARRVSDSVRDHPDQHSLIYLPNGFIIPGGRFKEIYYWDSYWILEGLLISEMTESVRGILENFLSIVEKFGFIPNGSRVYYLNRSQPPLLASMVGKYIDYSNNKTWLESHVDTIEKEMNWWWAERRVSVSKGGKTYDMFMYKVKSNTPRPESYYEDVFTCQNFTEVEKQTCYRNLKSGAESGWDYSTRWLFNDDRSPSSNLSQIDILHVIPVDLNAIICKSFEELSRFYQLIGNNDKSSKWSEKQNALKEAIHDVHYNEEDGIWYDYDLANSKQNKVFYPSNFAPLWSDAFDTSKKEVFGVRAAQYYKDNKVQKYPGGIPTSLINSGQQWDLPNAWPPLQEFIVLGLKKSGSRKAERLARSQGTKVLEAYMTGFESTNDMYEKYDAYNVGGYGGGGEYVVQSGFGWSNGEALALINEFYLKPVKKQKISSHLRHRHNKMNEDHQ
ncbi:trehalase-like [Diorhabda carinulata]|uniref:trehalase-like n=1 Tax=Diorhabda carinulata TaxID=1163345 RepID=UPI0025A1AE94|nr:trehalase-like [Diorhabda carinulata]XP_057670545.1 trehalase-like [Diorhabda carinulata]